MRYVVIARTLIEAPTPASATDRFYAAVDCDGLPEDVEVEAFSAEDDAEELSDLLALRDLVETFLLAPKLRGENARAHIALLDAARKWNGLGINEPLRRKVAP